LERMDIDLVPVDTLRFGRMMLGCLSVTLNSYFTRFYSGGDDYITVGHLHESGDFDVCGMDAEIGAQLYPSLYFECSKTIADGSTV